MEATPLVMFNRVEPGPGQLDALSAWLAMHDVAVMTMLFLVLGVLLIAKGSKARREPHGWSYAHHEGDQERGDSHRDEDEHPCPPG